MDAVLKNEAPRAQVIKAKVSRSIQSTLEIFSSFNFMNFLFYALLTQQCLFSQCKVCFHTKPIMSSPSFLVFWFPFNLSTDGRRLYSTCSSNWKNHQNRDIEGVLWHLKHQMYFSISSTYMYFSRKNGSCRNRKHQKLSQRVTYSVCTGNMKK